MGGRHELAGSERTLSVFDAAGNSLSGGGARSVAIIKVHRPTHPTTQTLFPHNIHS